METTNSILEVVGLLAVLGSAAIVFVNLAQWIAGKRRNHVRLGVEMLVFFSLAYGFHPEVLKFLTLSAYQSDTGGALATLWWLSLAFAINTALKKYVWQGILADRGESRVPRLLTDFASAAVYLIAIMAIMHFVYGEPITAIAATSGAAAFVIGYSAQTTLAELFAGISLNLSGNIKKGDYVEIDGTYGTVHDIDWRSVTVHHYFSESLVVFPNSVLATKPFRNYMHPEKGLRSTVSIIVEYSAPPNLVRRLMVEALDNSRHVLRHPAPFVFITGPVDLGIKYEFGFCFPSYLNWFDAQDEALSAVWSVLRRHGIRPGMNFRESAPGSDFGPESWPARQAAPEAATEAAAVAFLKNMDFLKAVPVKALAELNDAMQRLDFAPPEVVQARGDTSGTLYIVRDGRFDLMLADDDGEDFAAAELGPGDIFGGPAAPAGEAPNIRAQCGAYGVVYEIPEAAVVGLLAAHGTLADRLSALSEARATEFQGRRKAHAYDQRRQQREAEKSEIMANLTGQLGNVLKAGLFGGAAAKRRRENLLDATMAATALVAYADGEIEDQEREEVINTLTDLDLLRQTGAEDGIQRFDAYAKKLASDGEAGTAAALTAVGKLKDDPATAALVVDICIAVSAADGEIEDEEEARIDDIRAALNLQPTGPES